LVEILSPCPTAYGRRNRMGHPVKMMEWLRDNTVPVAKYEKMTPEEREGKVRTGIIVDLDLPEYTEQYDRLIESVKAGG
jgi:2-oxoglutarate ferredoxin oxidoreductase subunit beta